MKTGIDTWYANDLADIYIKIEQIVKQLKQKEKSPLLWFRGHEYEHYNLEPNLFRSCDYKYNVGKTYSQNHLREEYRFQNFMSRNMDKVDMRMPQTMIEWQEVMQHFGTKTRVMDWSESLIVALQFALEPFINPIKDLEVKEHCRTATPTLWILEPAEMNKELYDSLIRANKKVIEDALNFVNVSKRRALAIRIQAELDKEKNRGIYFDLNNENEKNMNVMISLSSLEMLRAAYKGREEQALHNFEMNPFFYLLLRYFADGIPVEQEIIPPLAIIHPYHSSRIKNQKGVFTVFPHYIPNESYEKMTGIVGKKLSIGMENMAQCIPYLHKIQILNPQKVAQQLMDTGARRGNLYPDMDIISWDMENAVQSI